MGHSRSVNGPHFILRRKSIGRKIRCQRVHQLRHIKGQRARKLRDCLLVPTRSSLLLPALLPSCFPCLAQNALPPARTLLNLPDSKAAPVPLPRIQFARRALAPRGPRAWQHERKKCNAAGARMAVARGASPDDSPSKPRDARAKARPRHSRQGASRAVFWPEMNLWRGWSTPDSPWP